MTDCKLLQEQYDLFALGVLEGEEHAEVIAHLEQGCERCTPGVEQARARVAHLALAAPAVEPPAAVRASLLAAVAPASARHARTPARSWTPAWAWATAAAMLLFAVFSHRQASEIEARSQQLEQQVADLEERQRDLSAQNENYRRVLAIVSAPGTVPVALNAPTSPQLRAYWNEDLGLVLAAQDMPGLRSGRTYQLWVIPKQGNPVSAGTFEPEPDGKVTYVISPDVSPSDAAALAITDEPSGGQPQPTTQPIWVGPLG